MSDVRLSSGSPTLERVDGRLSEQPKPSACRNLFGPVDHEELKRELKGHMRAMEEASTERYNFDFSTYTPLPHGRFIWTAVESTDLPSFYSSTGTRSLDLNGNHDGPADRREQHPAKSQRKRPAGLDSSCQTKRPHTCVDEVSCRPALGQQLDLTPLKSSPPRQT